MKILVCGLPGSGKSTIAKLIASAIGGVWLNADAVREEYNDWDFSIAGRERQALRMKLLSDGIVLAGKIAVADFVCPTPVTRELFKADYVVWMDTIKKGRFEDTNNIFVPLTNNEYDYHVSQHFTDAEKQSASILSAYLRRGKIMNLTDLKLVKAPAEILERQLAEVNIEDPGFDPKELKERMVDIMINTGGIGLSACQVGLDVQVFVMGDSKEDALICINPVVLQHTVDTQLEYEGCLSFPAMYVKIQRPKEILVQYYDENLEQQTIKITDYPARVFLHEYDHLQGITMKDRVSKMKWDRAALKKDKVKKKYKINA